MAESPRTISIASGIRYGLAFGTVFAAWASAAYLSGANPSWSREGISWPMVLLFYLGGGILTGAIVGALRSIAKSRAGSAFVGAVAGVPLGLAIRLAMAGVNNWRILDAAFISIFALAMGGGAGLVLHDVFSDEDETRSGARGGKDPTRR